MDSSRILEKIAGMPWKKIPQISENYYFKFLVSTVFGEGSNSIESIFLLTDLMNVFECYRSQDNLNIDKLTFCPKLRMDLDELLKMVEKHLSEPFSSTKIFVQSVPFTLPPEIVVSLNSQLKLLGKKDNGIEIKWEFRCQQSRRSNVIIKDFIIDPLLAILSLPEIQNVVIRKPQFLKSTDVQLVKGNNNLITLPSLELKGNLKGLYQEFFRQTLASKGMNSTAEEAGMSKKTLEPLTFKAKKKLTSTNIEGTSPKSKLITTDPNNNIPTSLLDEPIIAIQPVIPDNASTEGNAIREGEAADNSSEDDLEAIVHKRKREEEDEGKMKMKAEKKQATQKREKLKKLFF